MNNEVERNPNHMQIGGDHYKNKDGEGLEHWDMCYIVAWRYPLSAAWKYIDRLGKKGAESEQLGKAIHYLEKYKDLQSRGVATPHGIVVLDRVPEAEDYETRHLVDWCLERGYSILQLSFALNLAWGRIDGCIALLTKRLNEISPLVTSTSPSPREDLPLCEPGVAATDYRTYVDPDFKP